MKNLVKENEMEIINDWIPITRNPLYCSATSTRDGNGQVILAKFKAFLSHIVNKHTDLPDPLFNKCCHGPNITDRKWLVKGTCNSFSLVKQREHIFIAYLACGI